MIVKSLDHLNQISKKISKNLEDGDWIFLIGEIGVGKTTFTRCLINNLQNQKLQLRKKLDIQYLH